MILTIITVAPQDSGRLQKTLKSVANIPANVEHVSVIPRSDQKSLTSWHEFRGSVGPNFRLTNDLGIGVYEAMNAGIDASSGEYICFWNAGDELIGFNNSLEQTLQLLEEEKPSWLLVDGVFDWRESRPTDLVELRNFILHRNNGFISHQTTIVSRGLLKSIGNFNAKFKVAADVAAITRFTQTSSPYILDVQLVNVEKPNFAERNNRRGRFEALVIALTCLRGILRFQAVINIFWEEIQVKKRIFVNAEFCAKSHKMRTK